MGVLEDFAELTRSREDPSQTVAMSLADIEAAGGLERISDLKVGDKLVWKSKAHAYAMFPALEEVIEVQSVLSTPMPDRAGFQIFRDDFGTVFMHQGMISYTQYDSRFFKRV